MTLITMQDGKVLLKNEKVATEQACCCGGGGGNDCGTCYIPDFCNLVIFSDFGGFVLEHYNEPAINFFPAQGIDCAVSFTVEDVGYEGGGDIAGDVVFGLDENCCPNIASFVFARSGNCSDPGVDCWPLEARLDCPDPCPPENPLP